MLDDIYVGMENIHTDGVARPAIIPNQRYGLVTKRFKAGLSGSKAS